jgi:predicted small secreted protein
MLSAVTRKAIAALLCLATATALAACGTTSGAGSVARTGSSTQRHDFPTGLAPASGPSTSTPASSASSTAQSPAHPVPDQPLRTATAEAAGGTPYVVKVWADVKDSTCFDHAYGQPVITFLTEHPCRGLERLLATTTVHGRPVGLAISETSVAGTASDPYKYSGEFRQLLERDGTGSIDDLLRDGYRLPSGPTSIPPHEAFNVLGQDSGIDIYDAWYLEGSTPDNDPALIKMTEGIFLQV